MSAIAITDHDTIDGIDSAIKAGKKFGVEVIPGIEISAEYRGELHMLGYFHPVFWEYSLSEITGILANLQHRRSKRNIHLLSKLSNNGILVNMDDVQREAGGNLLSRLHIASAIVKKGYEKNISDVFAKHIGKGCYAYEPKEILTAAEAIEIINRAHGAAVLAHPYSIGTVGEELYQLIRELKDMKMAGLETHYWEYDDEQTENLVSIAKKLKLLETSGSDFHGHFRSNSMLGFGRGNMNADYSYVQKLKDYIVARHRNVLLEK